MDAYRKLIPLLVVLATFLAATGCSRKPLTEAEQYTELRDSFKYRTYLTLSREGLPLALSAYNERIVAEGIVGEEKLEEGVARMLLAFVWATSLKPDLALAEIELASEELQSPDERFLLHSLRAIALYEKGWPGLAREESAAGEAVYTDIRDRQKARMFKLTSYLVMGSLSIYEADFDAAHMWFIGLEVETGFHWPVQCVDIARDLRAGNIQTALQKTRTLADDPDLPSPVGVALRDLINRIEAEHGDIDSRLFIPRLIGRIAWQSVVHSSEQVWRHVSGFIDKLAGKLEF